MEDLVPYRVLNAPRNPFPPRSFSVTAPPGRRRGPRGARGGGPGAGRGLDCLPPVPCPVRAGGRGGPAPAWLRPGRGGNWQLGGRTVLPPGGRVVGGGADLARAPRA